MNWEAIGAMAQIIRVLVVVITVMYLAIQTRQNTLAVQASVRHGMLSEDCQLLYRQMDFPFVSVQALGRRELSDDQLIQVASWLLALFRMRESYWLQYRTGSIDAATWETYLVPLRGVLLTEMGRSLWRNASAMGVITASFAEEMDQHVARMPPTKIMTARELLGLVAAE